MLFSQATYVGIDPSAGEKPFVYAAIDGDLNLLALGDGNIEDVVAFAAGQQTALTAICGPRQPNQGVMQRAEDRLKLSPAPSPGRWENFRVAEYLLRKHNLTIPQTPALEDDCPNWIRQAFVLFRRLLAFGYRLYPDDEAACQLVEVFPHACFAAMLGLLPFHKHSLEGRLQRQLVLHEAGLNLPDPLRFFEEITRYRLLSGVLPLEFLYTPGELDALAAAYTAWKAAQHPGELILLGNPEEGQVAIPVAELKETYH